ncbi:BlaI/MecI/CopY family transcriptional regulator [Pseudoflavonifractor phocaeensis]|uniref:BlaI/MecI/CopY family transcriptional regulator n=1 Tax=Pseudoflavonifractor phocaeensis TaxID=1870988 RepID=UPI00313E0B10
MSDYASRRISEAELSVMEALWDAGTPMTAKELQETLKVTRGWERTTVRSLLTRLAEKGSVSVDKTADVAAYAAGFTRDEYGWDLTEVLVSRLYDGDAKALTAALCRHGCLDQRDLSDLEFHM